MTVLSNGILCVNKPANISSFDVIRFARKKWKNKKIGHTGTLDPIAEGVLILCFNAATKFSELFIRLPKIYEAEIRFGISTNTDDRTGDVISNADFSKINDEDILGTSKQFEGEIFQVPPQFSAVKVDGKPAYKMARKSEEFELKQRKVNIYNLDIKKIDLPVVKVEIECSSGTYIRSIARDWGNALGVGGILTALRRTSIGHIKLENCYTLEQLGQMDSPPFIDFDYAISFIPSMSVNAVVAGKIQKGDVSGTELTNNEVFRICENKQILFVKDENKPLALIQKIDNYKNGYKYLKVIPEWR
ncbi:MAG: tRNA pseudouridine(55) synthase TruB [candidate division Zixibacteria bacterium]|nr:tRNA pseudouridine(55) synthase TruB [candidate division Zixibacteria bacterium]